MNRPTRASVRLRPAVLLAALLVAAVVIACGGDASSPAPTITMTETTPASAPPSPSPTPTTAETIPVSVYFLRGEKLGVAERRVPRTQAVAAAAMRELCGGPTEEERAAGLGSAVPDGTELLGIVIRDGVATVDLTSQYASGGGSLSMTARVAQVVYTLTQFPTVKAVSFRLNGQPITALGGEGVAVAPPQTRRTWAEFEPAIFVEQPGCGAVLSNPFVLRGTASVFEGSFMAELRDDSGRRIVRTPVQASEGGPGRGDFRKVIAYTTAASTGTLIVYELSMEDGSRFNVVRIPVTFTK